MIQYQMEKTRMLVIAMKNTSTISTLAAVEDNPPSTSVSAVIFNSKPTVSTLLVMIIVLNSAFLRLRTHKPASTPIKAIRNTSQPVARPRLKSVVRLSNLPKVVLYEISPCISKINSKTNTTIDSDVERFLINALTPISTHSERFRKAWKIITIPCRSLHLCFQRLTHPPQADHLS